MARMGRGARGATVWEELILGDGRGEAHHRGAPWWWGTTVGGIAEAGRSGGGERRSIGWGPPWGNSGGRGWIGLTGGQSEMVVIGEGSRQRREPVSLVVTLGNGGSGGLC
jgi:hypothetical protein